MSRMARPREFRSFCTRIKGINGYRSQGENQAKKQAGRGRRVGRRSLAHRQRIAREAACGKFCEGMWNANRDFLRNWNIEVEDLYLLRISIFYTIPQSNCFTCGQ